jgi:type I restriction enzyme M protein
VVKKPSKATSASSVTPPALMLAKNLFCSRVHLTNEASVEKLFVDRLLEHLGFGDEDLRVKTSIQELKIGSGSSSSLYKPDYIIVANGFPAIVIDAKAPAENIDEWVKQCRSYCLELNTMYEHNPVEHYVLSNGLYTKLYSWDKGPPIADLTFSDFVTGNTKLLDLSELMSKKAVRALARTKHDELRDSDFALEPVSLDKIGSIFLKLHDYMREKEKKTPSAAFMELLKIVFVKIRKDRELREKIGTKTPNTSGPNC